jgi:outer membrane murein-binding lipoprotein Lpp
METAQVERKAVLESDLRRIDEEIRAAEERSGNWRARQEDATRRIAELSAGLQEVYAAIAAGRASGPADGPEADLAEARRLEAGCARLIRDESAKIAELRSQRQPLAEELDQLYHREAVEQERAKVEEMIAAAEASFVAFNGAAEKFLSDLGKLKEFKESRAVDENNRHLASDKWFSLQARVKGFAY